MGSFALARGPFNPGLASWACVSSTKSILWQWRQEYRNNYQVLLDDGNRIIIPQGNFKVYERRHLAAFIYREDHSNLIEMK